MTAMDERARKSGNRYTYDVKRSARDMRARGLGCPTIAQELGVSVRSVQMWTAMVPGVLKRICRRCSRTFEQTATQGSHRHYCSDACMRYARSERRQARRAA